jgi:hypothetical protein
MGPGDLADIGSIAALAPRNRPVPFAAFHLAAHGMDLITRQFVDPLRTRVQNAEPAAILLEPRVLRRVIRLDRRLQGLGLSIPHRKCYTIERDRLLAYVDRSELETTPGVDLPRTVILLAKPTEEELIAAGGADAALVHYGRLLLHASVHSELERLASGQADPNVWAAERLAQIGATEVAEIRQVLLKDDMLFPAPSELEIYVEFAAVYIELYHYAQQDLPLYFPGVRNWASIELIVSKDIDHQRLFERTRLIDPTCALSAAADDEPQSPAHTAEPSFISLAEFRRTQARAERAAAMGNGIMSAIWHTRAAQLAPRGCAAEAHGSARRELARFARRFQRALDFSTAEVDAWCTALEPLLAPASAGYWTTEARLLYDLQKVCIEQERNVYRLDLVEWVRTFGKRPIRRPLPLLRDALMIRHLRTALGRLATAQLARDEREHVAALLKAALRDVEEISRERIRPLILAALDEVGLVPQNVPEQVARRKLVEELVDRIVEHSYISMGDLRDALSKNDLKLPDVGSEYVARELPAAAPAVTFGQQLRATLSYASSWIAEKLRKFWAYFQELFFGDRLLRADRKLDVALDGIYRRGAIYMRWPQTLSSLAFGTPTGRFLTQQVAVPFGGAFLLLEFVRHIAHWIMGSGHTAGEMHVAAAARTAGAGPTSEAAGDLATHAEPSRLFAHLSDPSEWLFYACVLLLGLWISLLIHRPAFRAWTIAALHNTWHVLRQLLIELPQGVLNSQFVQGILNSQAFAVLHSYGIRPSLFTAVIWGMCYAAGYTVDARLAFEIFLVVALFLNSSIGNYAIEVTTDFLGRAWHELTMRVFAAVVQAVMEWFQGLALALERVVYAVDQFLRFRAGDNRAMQAVKAFGGVGWFFVSYVVVFVFTLLLEPQINPIKHFPVVTVSHKIILPTGPVFVKQLTPLIGKGYANTLVWTTIWLVPGVFGFLVWELKENWRLYAANRPPTLKPVPIGHHGETMVRLIRPGFHSGTLPKAFAALRRESRHADRANRRRQTRKQAVLHGIADAVERFAERELVFLLQEIGFAAAEQIHVGEVHLATNRIDVELRHHDKPHAPATLSWEDDGKLLRGSISREGWLAALSPHDRGVLAAALSGLFQRAGVDETVGTLPVKVLPPSEWNAWVATWSHMSGSIPLAATRAG